jgi:uncharacterized Zn ribbon protein
MENIHPTANNFIYPNCPLEWSVALEEKLQARGVYEYAHKNALTDGDHDISCRVGDQSMLLKPELIKKYEK